MAEQNNNQQSSQDYVVDLASSRYDFRYRVFPDDIGMENVGHYVILNINVPVDSSGKYRTELTSQSLGVSPLGEEELSSVDRLRAADGIIIPGQTFPTSFALERSTKRIAESIALYMPTPLIYSGQNMYQEVSLTSFAGEALMGIAGYGLNALKTFSKPLGEALETAIGGQAKPVSDASGSSIATVSRLGGYPINPAVEVLFANTPQRQFVFEFLLAPRNEKESLSLKEIIRTIRFHAAPELSSPTTVSFLGFSRDVLGGAYWIPPAEFDITFMNKGEENMNIIRINTCVLERCEVDYAPSGVYSTFSNGHPVAVRLSLGFREIEPVHKKRVLQGF